MLLPIGNRTGRWTEYWVTGSDATAAQSTVDITGLVSGTLLNSTKYEIEVVLDLLTAADTNGIKFAIHGGGATAAAVVSVTGQCTSTTGTTAAGFSITAPDVLTGAFLLTASQTGALVMKGFVITRSTGTATISVQMAKATGNSATCKIGSIMRIQQAHI